MIVSNYTDYRNTDQCPSLLEVISRKKALEQKISEKHKRTKIIYNRINDKQGEFFKEFGVIYNFKCAYCGASLKFTDSRLFEVDHYICESAFSKDTKGRAEAGKVKNLIFSCYSCNRGKGELLIKDNYVSILNPDDNSISKVFTREENFYINIREEHTKDEFIQLFYEKLLLGSEFRRLDFLLLEMDKLINHLQNSNHELASKLEQCMSRLMEKKNCAFI